VGSRRLTAWAMARPGQKHSLLVPEAKNENVRLATPLLITRLSNTSQNGMEKSKADA
jgi:hypothetical protein